VSILVHSTYFSMDVTVIDCWWGLYWDLWTQ